MITADVAKTGALVKTCMLGADWKAPSSWRSAVPIGLRNLTSVAVLAAACGGHGHHGPGHGHHRFEDPEQWARRWDSPERDGWQKGQTVIDGLGLADDAQIADIGAGTGYFAARLARSVPNGRVYAVDIEPTMVEHLVARAAREGLDNLRAVLGGAHDPHLPGNGADIDLLFLCNTYHHIEDRPAYFDRLRARLSHRGRLVIVDYRPDWVGEGPPPEMRLSAETVTAELEKGGYRPVRRDETTLERQYILIFEAAEAAPVPELTDKDGDHRYPDSGREGAQPQER